MTVRWKPLIVLTGLFLVVAVMSLLAFAFALPGKAEDVLPKARADAEAQSVRERRDPLPPRPPARPQERRDP